MRLSRWGPAATSTPRETYSVVGGALLLYTAWQLGMKGGLWAGSTSLGTQAQSFVAGSIIPALQQMVKKKSLWAQRCFSVNEWFCVSCAIGFFFCNQNELRTKNQTVQFYTQFQTAAFYAAPGACGARAALKLNLRDSLSLSTTLPLLCYISLCLAAFSDLGSAPRGSFLASSAVPQLSMLHYMCCWAACAVHVRCWRRCMSTSQQIH